MRCSGAAAFHSQILSAAEAAGVSSITCAAAAHVVAAEAPGVSSITSAAHITCAAAEEAAAYVVAAEAAGVSSITCAAAATAAIGIGIKTTPSGCFWCYLGVTFERKVVGGRLRYLRTRLVERNPALCERWLGDAGRRSYRPKNQNNRGENAL